MYLRETRYNGLPPERIDSTVEAIQEQLPVVTDRPPTIMKAGLPNLRSASAIARKLFGRNSIGGRGHCGADQDRSRHAERGDSRNDDCSPDAHDSSTQVPRPAAGQADRKAYKRLGTVMSDELAIHAR